MKMIIKEYYKHFKNFKDKKSIRKLINDSASAYWYFKNIKDRKMMRNKIANKNLIESLNNKVN